MDPILVQEEEEEDFSTGVGSSRSLRNIRRFFHIYTALQLTSH
jgi:hypothetical protein